MFSFLNATAEGQQPSPSGCALSLCAGVQSTTLALILWRTHKLN